MLTDDPNPFILTSDDTTIMYLNLIKIAGNSDAIDLVVSLFSLESF